MRLGILLGVMVSAVLSLWGIEPAHSISEVNEFLKDSDSDTLVVWDVDMVLVHPKEPAFQMGNMGRHKQRFLNMFGPLDAEERAVTLCLISTEGDLELLNPEVIHVLEDLRQRQVPHIALTGCLTGPLANVDSLEDLRITQLEQLGVSFADVTPLKGEAVFNEMPLYRRSPVVYKQGIIFANGRTGPKGDALVCFLRRCKHPPTSILFIDDHLHYLEDVEEKLRAFDDTITYRGLHYLGAKHVDSSPVTEEEFSEMWNGLITHAQEICAEEN